MKIVPGAIAFSVHRKFDSDRVSLSREETNLTRSIWMAPTITQPAVRDADLRKAVKTALPDTSRPPLLRPYRPFRRLTWMGRTRTWTQRCAHHEFVHVHHLLAHYR